MGEDYVDGEREEGEPGETTPMVEAPQGMEEGVLEEAQEGGEAAGGARQGYGPVIGALRDLAYILDKLTTRGPLKMGIFITNEVTKDTPAVVHFYPKDDEQARALVQAINRAAEQRLTWEEDLLSAPALVLTFGRYLELSMEVKP